MPTFDITAPDGTKYEVTGPDGSTEQDALAQVMKAHAAAPLQATGPQPTTLQTIAASPVGRFIHDVPLSFGEGAARLAAKALPLVGGDALSGLVDSGIGAIEKPYQAAITAQQNRPGYAQARQAVDNMHIPSGFTNQITAPFNPTFAGLFGAAAGGDQGRVNQMNANADSQAAAQDDYAKSNPVKSFTANILGGLAAGPDGAMKSAISAPQVANQVAKPFIPSIADLKAASRGQYRAVDNSGVRISPDAMNNMADGFEDKFGDEIDPVLYPKATAAYNRVLRFGTEGEKGADPATFADLNKLRRVVGAAAKSSDTADAGLAGQMIDHLDNFTNGLQAHDLDTTLQDELRANLTAATGQKGQIAKQISSIEQNKPGALAARGAAGAGTRATYMDLQAQLPQAEAARQAALGQFKSESDLINGGPQATIDALNNARGLWARAKQTETLQGVISDAQLNAGKGASLEQSLRNGFASLAKNDKQMARLSPEVQTAVKQVVMGSPLSNVLRYAGKLAPRGIVSTALSTGMGGAVGGVPGAIALPMVGEAARAGSAALTSKAAQRASDIAALGKTAVRPLPQMPLRLPQLTPQSQLPYGMIGALPQLQQRQ